MDYKEGFKAVGILWTGLIVAGIAAYGIALNPLFGIPMFLFACTVWLFVMVGKE